MSLIRFVQATYKDRSRLMILKTTQKRSPYDPAFFQCLAGLKVSISKNEQVSLMWQCHRTPPTLLFRYDHLDIPQWLTPSSLHRKSRADKMDPAKIVQDVLNFLGMCESLFQITSNPSRSTNLKINSIR